MLDKTLISITSELDSDSMLIISICERIYQLEGLETKYPEHYLKQNRKGIDGLGAVLELLSLARTNRRRAIGWQPTGELMRIIANRKKGMRRKVARRKASPRNAYMVSLLFVAALEKLALKYGKKKLTGEETSLACSLSRDFLRELGLLSEDPFGDDVGSADLLDRFAEKRLQ